MFHSNFSDISYDKHTFTNSWWMRQWKRTPVPLRASLYTIALLVALKASILAKTFSRQNSFPSWTVFHQAAPELDAGQSPERRVISFSLFGNDSRYVNGALRNLELAATFYPGWKIHFYIDQSVPLSVLTQLQTSTSKIILVDDDLQRVPGAYWRFVAADDPDIDRYIMRDVDSRLNVRDQLAVEEWILSGKPFHVMRDHPSHCGWPINAGMWGGTKGAMGNMRQALDEWIEIDGKETRYDQDQRFLRDVIWPNRPRDFQHIGQVFFGDDTPRQGDIDMLAAAKAPDPCRLHAEWEYG